MTTASSAPKQEAAERAYEVSYANFVAGLKQEIRRETWGEDIGQQSWITVDEQQRFIEWLEIGPDSRVLDVASGSGGPTLHLAKVTGCHAVGVDVQEEGVVNANMLAAEQDLSDRVRFQHHDASQPLPFEAKSFDAVMCIDAINHLPDRTRVFADWKRVLKPGRRLLFTDPIIITGPLTKEEIAVRSSIGFYLYVPPNEDERLVEAAGLTLLVKEDVTQNVARIAGRWLAARAAREAALRKLEGDDLFEGQQNFLRVSELIARERRLSRFVYVAQKPS